MPASTIEWVATVIFTIAIVHTFTTVFFARLAHRGAAGLDGCRKVGIHLPVHDQHLWLARCAGGDGERIARHVLASGRTAPAG